MGRTEPVATLSTWQLKNRCAFLVLASEALRRIEIASRNAIEIGNGERESTTGQQGIAGDSNEADTGHTVRS